MRNRMSLLKTSLLDYYHAHSFNNKNFNISYDVHLASFNNQVYMKALSQGMPRYKQLKYYTCTRLSCDPTSKRNALLMENGVSGLPGNRLNAIATSNRIRTCLTR